MSIAPPRLISRGFARRCQFSAAPRRAIPHAEAYHLACPHLLRQAADPFRL